MKMKNLMLPLLLLVVLLSACAHAPAPAPLPALASAHQVSAWTGDIRIAVGNSSVLEGGELALVESTVSGLISTVGASARVQCLDHEGDIGGTGVVHARVRVEFPDRMTIEQKFGALHLLEGLQPTEGAYKPLPAVNGNRAPSAPVAQTR